MLSNGEKLVVLKNRLTAYCIDLFASTGVDGALAVLILDGVRGDIYKSAFSNLTERVGRMESGEDIPVESEAEVPPSQSED